MIPEKLEFCAGYIMWREKQPETQITIYPKQGFSDSELAAEIVRRYNTFTEPKIVNDLLAALRTIAKYERDDTGCCPFGCDTPNIAKLAIQQAEAK
jgi:hypothetical protein